MARALDGHRQLALMEGAGACDAAGNDLRALGHIFAQAGNIFVIDVLDAVYAEAANLCLLYTSPSPRDRSLSRMPSSA